MGPIWSYSEVEFGFTLSLVSVFLLSCLFIFLCCCLFLFLSAFLFNPFLNLLTLFSVILLFSSLEQVQDSLWLSRSWTWEVISLNFDRSCGCCCSYWVSSEGLSVISNSCFWYEIVILGEIVETVCLNVSSLVWSGFVFTGVSIGDIVLNSGSLLSSSSMVVSIWVGVLVIVCLQLFMLFLASNAIASGGWIGVVLMSGIGLSPNGVPFANSITMLFSFSLSVSFMYRWHSSVYDESLYLSVVFFGGCVWFLGVVVHSGSKYFQCVSGVWVVFTGWCVSVCLMVGLEGVFGGGDGEGDSDGDGG